MNGKKASGLTYGLSSRGSWLRAPARISEFFEIHVRNKPAKQFNDMCVVGVGTVTQALSYCEEACAQQLDLYRLG